MKWTPSALVFLVIKNLTGSGKWARRYYREAGYDIHPSATIGGGVILDSANPERIHIREHAIIGNGAIIIAHGPHVTDDIVIGYGAFIGAGAIVMASVDDRATIAAGSVVTKKVPLGEIWAGNPAKRMK